mmetsp:Transcript_16712/g.19076  ORF Transcript_16712/g.19076 Transcript_16712/m.19076 type:complete len:555 (+) Transcript_16712:190-1854(+)
MFPSIDASDVGNTGLLWLFISYGYLLFKASNLISEGSELLLLVPSLAGLVGGVVLPLLGAVPDGAIMLFSGLGDISTAQETLSVGVGALAGSTIMLLTVPWGLSVLAGRVDIKPDANGNMVPIYKGKQKLTEGRSLEQSGVIITEDIKHAALIMLITTIPYFLIQIPAFFIHGTDSEIADGEAGWALGAFVICLIGFVSYLAINVKASKADEAKFHRVEKIKDLLKKGGVSLSGAMYNVVLTFDEVPAQDTRGEYGAINTNTTDGQVPMKTREYMKSVLSIPFQKYDIDTSKGLDRQEMAIFLRDFKENLSNKELDTLFDTYDTDGNGTITFDEFVDACHSLIVAANVPRESLASPTHILEHDFAKYALENEGDDDEEEEEEVPDDIAHLSPMDQQVAIKKKAFTMLGLGTFFVLLFSDPMVDVMQEIAVRIKISPFYVSFILAPLASNASEVLASQYYASKKTTKTITVAFSTLLGAAAMNNTFCLSIFMGLIYFRGLAWEFTAETIAIVGCQLFIYFMTKGSTMTALKGVVILSAFPLSIALVSGLEALGFD